LGYLAAILIEDPRTHVGVCVAGRLHHQKLIATDSAPPIRQQSDLLGAKIELSR